MAWIALLAWAPSPRGRAAALVYGASLCTLFLMSALYHRRTWSRRARRVLGKLDHAAIWLLIAGTYTPLCVLVGGATGRILLATAWAGALLGVAKALLWHRAPKRVDVTLYVVLGWIAVSVIPAAWSAAGAGAVLLLLAGGVAYTVGAIVYARRRPNPFPRVFGYHEVFHALVVVAATAHFVASVAAIGRIR